MEDDRKRAVKIKVLEGGVEKVIEIEPEYVTREGRGITSHINAINARQREAAQEEVLSFFQRNNEASLEDLCSAFPGTEPDTIKTRYVEGLFQLVNRGVVEFTDNKYKLVVAS